MTEDEAAEQRRDVKAHQEILGLPGVKWIAQKYGLSSDQIPALEAIRVGGNGSKPSEVCKPWPKRKLRS